MTIQLLLSAIVRQTTVLIAQLATSGGARAPLAQVASQVFLDLVTELERQGVSRKVSADMFGLGLRTYQRKIQRLTESSTETGSSLWSAVLGFLRDREVATRAQVLERLHRDDEVQVRSVLHDLVESGLVFSSGSGSSSVYRVATEQELGRVRQLHSTEGLDELVWAIVFREGPLPLDDLVRQGPFPEGEIEAVLGRLEQAGRVIWEASGERRVCRASDLFVPMGSPIGWEAAVFDHFQAVVRTICQRLERDPARPADVVGGSTYGFEVWPGHPLEAEVLGTLGRLREELGSLRERVDGYNAERRVPSPHRRVVVYVGQSAVDQENGDEGEHA
jgi:hypothetical protein